MEKKLDYTPAFKNYKSDFENLGSGRHSVERIDIVDGQLPLAVCGLGQLRLCRAAPRTDGVFPVTIVSRFGCDKPGMAVAFGGCFHATIAAIGIKGDNDRSCEIAFSYRIRCGGHLRHRAQ